MAQKFKGTPALFKGEFTDFKGLQPLIDDYKSRRVLEIVSSQKFNELAAHYCQVYYHLLSRKKNSAGIGVLQEISDRTDKILKLYEDKENPNRIKGAWSEIKPLKLAIDSCRLFVQGVEKRTEDEARKIGHKTPNDVEVDSIAEHAVIISINHYFNNKTGAVSFMLDLATRTPQERFPVSDAHIAVLRDFHSLFTRNAEFLKDATPSQIVGKLYLKGKDFPMILFPSDPEYQQPAA